VLSIFETPTFVAEAAKILVYPKAEKDNIPGHVLREIRKELEDDNA
jgi:hypothetical protein